MKRFFSQLIIAIIILLLMVMILWALFLRSPVIVKNDLTYILNPGTTVKQLAQDLHDQAHLPYPQLFRWLAIVRLDEYHLKTGAYAFPVGSTAGDILDQVVAGKVIYYPFIIVNGWTYQQVMTKLQDAPAVKHTLTHLSPEMIAKKLGEPYPSLEGLLMPNTYYYTYQTSDLDILRFAHTAMQNYIQTAWQARPNNLPYKNYYHALMVASMIEKESALAREKPFIAAVILRRLNIGMPLQIDSTVIYGLGSLYKGHITHWALRFPTPYNSYIHYGLPPTPIAMPGIPSIQAALHPAETDVLYFVAKGDGSHVFSSTLVGQNTAVRKYQLNKTTHEKK
ncbi:MAG: endolytic transglycosylase MltG [Pseudomonadota bacterium]